MLQYMINGLERSGGVSDGSVMSHSRDVEGGLLPHLGDV